MAKLGYLATLDAIYENRPFSYLPREYRYNFLRDLLERAKRHD